jgi:hypothetical protein
VLLYDTLICCCYIFILIDGKKERKKERKKRQEGKKENNLKYIKKQAKNYKHKKFSVTYTTSVHYSNVCMHKLMMNTIGQNMF